MLVRRVLAMGGLGLVAAALAGVGVAVLPDPPGRLGYDSIVANAAAPRLALLAAAGSGLAAPAVASGDARRLGVGTLVLGALAGGAALGLTLPALGSARTRGLRVSLRRAVLGSRPPTPGRGTLSSWRLPIARPDPVLDEGAAVSVVTIADEPGRRLIGDLYRPRAGQGAAIVVVHGGAWRGGGRGENRPWSMALAALGYTVLDVDYRLAPSAGGWSDAVSDILDAHRWLGEHAAALALDPDRIALLGRSAGGHLALLAAYAAPQLELAPIRQPAAVVALYAPSDLARLYHEAGGHADGDVRSGLLALLGQPPPDDPDLYRQASPLAYVRAGLAPTLLIHGTWDGAVPVDHTRRLARALTAAGAPVDSVLLPAARHAFDLMPDSVSSQLAFEAVLAALARI
jgi:acetyl esterase/lipase